MQDSCFMCGRKFIEGDKVTCELGDTVEGDVDLCEICVDALDRYRAAEANFSLDKHRIIMQ
jgi:hypothetical protein